MGVPLFDDCHVRITLDPFVVTHTVSTYGSHLFPITVPFSIEIETACVSSS